MESIDPKLIQEVQQGDQTAFQALYDICYQHVYSYALKLSHNEAGYNTGDLSSGFSKHR